MIINDFSPNLFISAFIFFLFSVLYTILFFFRFFDGAAAAAAAAQFRLLFFLYGSLRLLILFCTRSFMCHIL